jgi:iron complex outermembrane receptor protein
MRKALASGKTALGLLVASMMLMSSALSAQNASLNGKVTDSATGDVLIGANVVVKASTAGGSNTGGATNADGMYQVSGIQPGMYIITVTYIGYTQKSVSAVNLEAGQALEMDFALDATALNVNAISVTASRRQEKTLEAPASISVLSGAEMRGEVTASSSNLLRNTVGVDVANTGIDRSEIVLRGFNNAFSGAAYVLTDYRQSAVPSLGVNIHSIMPAMPIDLAKAEIVRGPGSALYGPGVDAGVVHYITKDPFEDQSTKLTVSAGERGSRFMSFRDAFAPTDKFAFKFTGSFGQADDWELDPDDPTDAAQLASDVPGTSRSYAYKKANMNAMFVLKPEDDLTFTATMGFSRLDATVLSGIGTVQADGFGYTYGQLRMQAGRFFAQTYVTKNDAGDSFVYGTGSLVVDKSRQINAQAQYDFDMRDGKQNFILGVDYDNTSPDTEGTIYGRNEEDDNISEFGSYIQSATKIGEKLDLTLALRGDYNNIIDEFQVSPRVALVAKANAANTFRATYNRAFSSPGNNSLFLDIVAQRIAFTSDKFLIARGRGARDGYTFNAARSQGGITAHSLIPVDGLWNQPVIQFGAAGVPTKNVPLLPLYGIMHSGLAAMPAGDLANVLFANGVGVRDGGGNLVAPLPAQMVSALVAGLAPQAGVLPQGLTSSILSGAPVDVPVLGQTTTQTFELGYKGLINNKMLFAVDFYQTTKEDFVGPLRVETPQAGFIPGEFAKDMTPALAAAIAGAPIGAQLQAMGLPAQAVAALLVGMSAGQIEGIPVGVVQPDQNIYSDHPEVMLTYRNFGKVSFWGVDAAAQYLATDNIRVFGNVSYVSDDFFDNTELDETDTELAVALNAPTLKAKGGFTFDQPSGWTFGGSLRYTEGFPVRSGPYNGDVDSYFLVDLNFGRDLSDYWKGMRLDIMIQNALDEVHREFIGAPQIGRLALARLSFDLN